MDITDEFTNVDEEDIDVFLGKHSCVPNQIVLRRRARSGSGRAFDPGTSLNI